MNSGRTPRSRRIALQPRWRGPRPCLSRCWGRSNRNGDRTLARIGAGRPAAVVTQDAIGECLTVLRSRAYPFSRARREKGGGAEGVEGWGYGLGDDHPPLRDTLHPDL